MPGWSALKTERRYMLSKNVTIVPTKPRRKAVVGEDASITENIATNGISVNIDKIGKATVSDHQIIFVISIRTSN
jgi:hypothetical protein